MKDGDFIRNFSKQGGCMVFQWIQWLIKCEEPGSPIEKKVKGYVICGQVCFHPVVLILQIERNKVYGFVSFKNIKMASKEW